MMTNKEDSIDTANWPPHVETVYVVLSHEEIKMGNLLTSTFKEKQWTEIEAKVCAKIEKRYNVKQLKSEFNRLREQHRIFAWLLGETGGGWNQVTNTVHIEDDKWEELIKKQPKVARFRRRGCEHYSLLGEIFNSITATGKLHYASTQEPPDSADERELVAEFLNAGVHVDVIIEAKEQGTSTAVSKRHYSAVPKDRRSSKEVKESEMSAALQAWTEALNPKTEVSFAKATRYKKQATEASNSTHCLFTISECMDVLQTIEGVNDAIFVRALEKFKDPDWREMFIKMIEPRKKA